MSFRFSCPTCNNILSLPVNSPGATVTCPCCGAQMQLPGPSIPVALPAEPPGFSPLIFVRTDDHSPELRPGFLQGKKKKPARGTARALARGIVTVFKLMACLALIAGFAFLALLLIAYQRPAPPIEVRVHNGAGVGLYESYFEIKSVVKETFQIYDVTYNSEYYPWIVYMTIGETLAMSDDEFPVTMTIGKSILVGWHYYHPNDPKTYRKDVIYLDVLTNQGYFRFDKHGNLLQSDLSQPDAAARLKYRVLSEYRESLEQAREVAMTKRHNRRDLYLGTKEQQIIADIAKTNGITPQEVEALIKQ
ncbi:MAG: hypothetical protein ACLQGP_26200 [Isosphaeraceae bacterium]